MRPFSFFYKLIAVFLSLVLPLASNVSSAVPASVTLKSNPSRPALFADIKIPEELGRVEESGGVNTALPGALQKTVIYIQDAHDSLEAQENIAKIIQFLVARYGVTTVYEEGYEGPVPTDRYFGTIKDPKIREKVAYFLMDKLRLGGAEYAHITRTENFKLFGADSFTLHKKNIEKYQKSAAHRKETEKNLAEMDAAIRKLAQQYFTKDLKEWMGIQERLDRRELDLRDYLKRTLALFLKGIGFEEFCARYPHLSLLLSAEKQNDPVKKGTGNHSPPGRFLSQINAETIFTEMNRLEDDYAARRLTGERERKIFRYYKKLQLLKRLNAIEVTEEEYAAVKKGLKEFDTAQIAEFLAAEGHKSVVLSRNWEANIQSAIGFYEVAHQRDQVIETALAEKGTGHDLSPFPVILVFGGFHKQNVKAMLRRNGFSYVIISPKITLVSPKHREYYKQLMQIGYQSLALPALVAKALNATRALEYVFENPVDAGALSRLILDVAAAVQMARAGGRGETLEAIDLQYHLLERTHAATAVPGRFHAIRSEMRRQEDHEALTEILRPEASAAEIEKEFRDLPYGGVIIVEGTLTPLSFDKDFFDGNNNPWKLDYGVREAWVAKDLLPAAHQVFGDEEEEKRNTAIRIMVEHNFPKGTLPEKGSDLPVIPKILFALNNAPKLPKPIRGTKSEITFNLIPGDNGNFYPVLIKTGSKLEVEALVDGIFDRGGLKEFVGVVKLPGSEKGTIDGIVYRIIPGLPENSVPDEIILSFTTYLLGLQENPATLKTRFGVVPFDLEELAQKKITDFITKYNQIYRLEEERRAGKFVVQMSRDEKFWGGNVAVLELSEDFVRDVLPQIPLIFDLMEEHGVTAKIFGSSVLTLALAKRFGQKIPLSDIDVAVSENYFNQYLWQSMEPRYKEETEKKKIASIVLSPNMGADFRQMLESDLEWSISKFWLERKENKYFLKGPAMAFEHLEEKKLILRAGEPVSEHYLGRRGEIILQKGLRYAQFGFSVGAEDLQAVREFLKPIPEQLEILKGSSFPVGRSEVRSDEAFEKIKSYAQAAAQAVFDADVKFQNLLVLIGYPVRVELKQAGLKLKAFFLEHFGGEFEDKFLKESTYDRWKQTLADLIQLQKDFNHLDSSRMPPAVTEKLNLVKAKLFAAIGNISSILDDRSIDWAASWKESSNFPKEFAQNTQYSPDSVRENQINRQIEEWREWSEKNNRHLTIWLQYSIADKVENIGEITMNAGQIISFTRIWEGEVQFVDQEAGAVVLEWMRKNTEKDSAFQVDVELVEDSDEAYLQVTKQNPQDQPDPRYPQQNNFFSSLSVWLYDFWEPYPNRIMVGILLTLLILGCSSYHYFKKHQPRLFIPKEQPKLRNEDLRFENRPEPPKRSEMRAVKIEAPEFSKRRSHGAWQADHRVKRLPAGDGAALPVEGDYRQLALASKPDDGGRSLMNLEQILLKAGRTKIFVNTAATVSDPGQTAEELARLVHAGAEVVLYQSSQEVPESKLLKLLRTFRGMFKPPAGSLEQILKAQEFHEPVNLIHYSESETGVKLEMDQWLPWTKERVIYIAGKPGSAVYGLHKLAAIKLKKELGEETGWQDLEIEYHAGYFLPSASKAGEMMTDLKLQSYVAFAKAA